MRGYPTRSLLSGRSDRSAWQVHAGAQAALRRGFEAHIAAMAARPVARDRQAEANPAGRGVARGVEADEWVKHPLAFSRRDARRVTQNCATVWPSWCGAQGIHRSVAVLAASSR